MTERQALEGVAGRSRFDGNVTCRAAVWALAEIDRLTAENARPAAELAAERADRDAAWFDRGDTDNQDGEGQS